MAKGAYIGVNEQYTVVSYLENTGSSYINTEFKPNAKTRVVLSGYNNSTDSTVVFGSGGNNAASIYSYDLQYGWYYAGQRYSAVAYPYTGAINIDCNKYTCTVNGSSASSVSNATFQNNFNMYLFTESAGTVGSGASPEPSNGRFLGQIYSCQIYDNDVLIRDFIPCINASGVAGLYDNVNGKFYTNKGSGTFTTGAATGEVISVSKARKIKKGYIGVETEVPVYDIQTTTTNITSSNISTYFTVTNGSYYFYGNGSTFTTTNGGIGGSTARTRLTAKNDMDVSFTYSYASEASFDKFTLIVGATTVENAVSGAATTKSYSGTLSAGSSIDFIYTKDGSVNSNGDKCTFSNMSITIKVTTQVGTEFKEVARKICKAYIGIGGVARPCWNSGELEYYGTITPLSVARRALAATTVGNYALFGGGGTGNGAGGEVTTVDPYNASLTRKAPISLGTARANLAATTVGDYALFGGGSIYNGATYGESSIEAYNSSLVGTILNTTTTLLRENCSIPAATTVGNYALFGGSRSSSSAYISAYDTSLTRTSSAQLSVSRWALAATTVGNYALFGGGNGSPNSSITLLSTVDAYNTSLTRTIPTTLITARHNLAAATVGNYALFGGGTTRTSGSGPLITLYGGSTVDAYDTSLTSIIPTGLSVARMYLAATTVGNYAVFGGGCTESGSINSSTQYERSTVDAYDESLTRTTPTELSVTSYDLAATTIGNYALFGGGRYTGSDSQITVSNIVDVYTV
jgi:hypothetical protein